LSIVLLTIVAFFFFAYLLPFWQNEPLPELAPNTAPTMRI
jgi:hypothetical protein